MKTATLSNTVLRLEHAKLMGTINAIFVVTALQPVIVIANADHRTATAFSNQKSSSNC